MDIFSHALWGNLQFRLIPQTKNHPHLIGWGIFFNIFPDLFTFTYPFLWILWNRFVTKKLEHWPRNQFEYEALPISDLTWRLYQWSHSIFIWAIVTGLTWFVLGVFPWPLLGWVTHIFIDIPTHEKNFYPTPYLWPLSHPYVDGWAWARKSIVIANTSALIIAYGFYIF